MTADGQRQHPREERTLDCPVPERGGQAAERRNDDTQDEALARAKVAALDANPPAAELVYPRQIRGRLTVAAYAPGWLEGQELLEANSVRSPEVRSSGSCPTSAGWRARTSPLMTYGACWRRWRSGLSDGTVSRTLDVARQLLPKAATDGVRYRIKERRRMQVATRQQATAIESAIDARYRLLVRMAFTTGARWCELTAIRGTDVEKRGAGYVVKIQRTIEEVGTTFTERGYGKTAAAVRTSRFPRTSPGAGGIRKGAVLHRAARRLPQALDLPPGLLAAGDREGRVPGMRVHDMRHSAISWWVAAHIPLADVRDRAGHSSIAVTNTYIHAVPADDDPFRESSGRHHDRGQQIRPLPDRRCRARGRCR